MSNTEKRRFGYADWIKVLSTVAVVVVHLCMNGWKLLDGSFNWQVINLFNSLSHVAVPLFLMVSGALFLNPAKELPLKKVYGKYILRLAVAFVFWSAIYATVDYFDGLHISSVLKNLVTGHFHMWFIFLLIMLYAVAPLLQKLCADRKTLGYFLFLSAIFTVILPFLGRYAGAVKTFSGYFYMQFAVGYTFCFAAGYYLHTYPIKKPVRIVLYAAGILGAIVTVLVNTKLQKPTDYWFDAFTPPMVAMYLAVFTAFRYGVGDRPAPKVIETAATCTLGAYLMHSLPLQLMEHFGIAVNATNAVWFVPLVGVAVAALCLWLSYLGRKIPVVGKYLF